MVQLGPKAESAIPELIELAKDGNTPHALNSLVLLGNIHSQPQITIPALHAVLRAGDLNRCRLAAGALREFGPQAKSAVPALISLLQTTTNIGLKADFAGALLKIDPESAAKAGIK
jgi:HEAT repeat protein